MRIDANEAIEIVSYGIGSQMAEAMKKHLAAYNDWGRVKQLIISALNDNTLKNRKNIEQIKKLRKEIEDLLQVDAFPIYGNNFKPNRKLIGNTPTDPPQNP